jgi:hypothetical protein
MRQHRMKQGEQRSSLVKPRIKRFFCCAVSPLILFFFSCGNHSAVDRASKDSANSLPSLIPCSCPDDSVLPDTAFYTETFLVVPNDSGYVNVRSNSLSFENAYRGNILCRIACNTELRGYGPVKNKEAGSGFAYVVLIEDKEGKRCRGYIAYHLIRKKSK